MPGSDAHILWAKGNGDGRRRQQGGQKGREGGWELKEGRGKGKGDVPVGRNVMVGMDVGCRHAVR